MNLTRLLSFIPTLFLLSSCYFSQTYLTVSEVGRGHDLASLPAPKGQTVWQKDGYYYTRASLARYKKTYKYGEYITPTPSYNNKCKYVPLDEPTPIDGYIKLSKSQFESLVSASSGKNIGSNMLFTWIPTDDFVESKTYELPKKYVINHTLISCNTFSRENTYRIAIQDTWYHPLMQPVAFLDAVFIDVPVSIVVTPFYWIYTATNDGELPGEKQTATH